MNAIQLPDKETDDLFLEGETVECSAAVTLEALQRGIFEEGEKIVVLLSNRKKYLGEIKGFSYEVIKQYAEGKLLVTKMTR